MRPFYAFAAAGAILAIVAGYMKFQAAVARPPATIVEKTAEGKFDVELTLTFDAGADAFSLGGESLVVSFRDRKLIEKTEPIAAGTPLVIRDVQGIVAASSGESSDDASSTDASSADDAASAAGRNEFYIKATPAEPDRETDEFALDESPSSRPVSRAVRVRILRDGVPIGDQTLWSEPGQPVEGVAAVEVEPAPSDPTVDRQSEHDHETH
jgi:hypothetical protein